MSEELVDGALAQFLAVAEHGSFSRAARALHISQPSLSVAVKKLEERLGATLLHRSARGVTPTPAGEVLLARARQAVAVLQEARDEVATLVHEPRGRFQIGCHESLAAYFLPGFMGPFLERYSEIQLSLFNANSKDVEQAVIERRIDLGVVVNSGRHPDTVVRDLFRDSVSFVVARKLRKKARSGKALLSRVPVLMVPEIRQSQAILAALRDLPIRTLACSSMELVKSLVLDGVGVGILPYRVATYGVASGRLEVLSPDLPRYDDVISLVRRADAPMTAGYRVLVDEVQGHGKSRAPLPKALRRKGGSLGAS